MITLHLVQKREADEAPAAPADTGLVNFTKAVMIMFAQKKKKSKLWLIIPVILALGAGLWLNADFEDGTSSAGDAENSAVQADSDQYEDIEDISDLSGMTDTSPEDKTSGPAESGEEKSDVSGRSGTGYSDSDGSRDVIAGEDSVTQSSGRFGSPEESGGGDTGDNTDEDQDSEEKNGTAKIFLTADGEGNVIIYRYDAEGVLISRTETEIQLSMLTEADQKFFTEGVTLNSESELSELLQDFEG